MSPLGPLQKSETSSLLLLITSKTLAHVQGMIMSEIQGAEYHVNVTVNKEIVGQNLVVFFNLRDLYRRCKVLNHL